LQKTLNDDELQIVTIEQSKNEQRSLHVKVKRERERRCQTFSLLLVSFVRGFDGLVEWFVQKRFVGELNGMCLLKSLLLFDADVRSVDANVNEQKNHLVFEVDVSCGVAVERLSLLVGGCFWTLR